MPISTKPTKIEITYSNIETQKLGIKVGDQFTAYREYYFKLKTVIVDGKPEFKKVRVLKQNCWFQKDGIDCIAYKCQHDEDAMMPVTTCKIVKE